MTGGNHTWDKKEIIPYIDKHPRMIRPANFPAGAPGRGHVVAPTSTGIRIGVVNIMGRVFMTALDDPFRVVLAEIDAVREDGAAIVFVDFHAEATSEKVAMGWHLDGRATAVVGTHTHVATADERVLPQGTAYITDVGMTGPHDSVIGVDRGAIVQRFLTAMPQRFETATENPRLNGVIVDADETSGRATSIARLSLSTLDIEALVAQPVAAR
jgi:metallophosphoesterase (TIGR00282 family)